MLRAHTVEEVRAAEAALMATVPEGTLMQRAAYGLANLDHMLPRERVGSVNTNE